MPEHDAIRIRIGGQIRKALEQHLKRNGLERSAYLRSLISKDLGVEDDTPRPGTYERKRP